jgi:hypothetical protein
MEPRNRFQGMNSASLCSLAGRYDNPIPPRLLAPIDCLKIPAPVQLRLDWQALNFSLLIQKPLLLFVCIKSPLHRHGMQIACNVHEVLKYKIWILDTQRSWREPDSPLRMGQDCYSSLYSRFNLTFS